MSAATGPMVDPQVAGSPGDVQIATVRDLDDTLDLRYGLTRGAAAPRRFVVFLNGRTEWLEKYHYLAPDLRLPGDCGFLTMDHRGQGASGGVRAYVDSYDTYARDTSAVIAKVCGDKPYALITHSMGGLIGLYGVLEGHLKPKTLVLSSPLLGMPNAPVPRPLARPVAAALTALRLGGVSSGAGGLGPIPFADNLYTHQAERYAAMLASPYPVGGATFGWVAATFKATLACFDPKLLATLRVPTLLLGGTKEGIVEYEAFHRWVRLASAHAAAEVQLCLVQGARHELFSEVPEYYDVATGAVRHWLKGFLGA